MQKPIGAVARRALAWLQWGAALGVFFTGSWWWRPRWWRGAIPPLPPG
ncbi:MAG: hypothetical protein HC915_09655 [Anaerolineae bacterium]|nr:hypothetical protein [Anaerolineae bacterium]